MTEAQFHQIMNAIYDLAGRVDQDPELAWKLPQLVVAAARKYTDGTPAAEWVERWKMGDPPRSLVEPDSI